jgi:putative transcriptional regulator
VIYCRKRIERRITMPVSYDKLWKLLIDKKMNRTELKEAAGISFNVLAKMGKSEFISMESLYKICTVLECDIGDVIEFTEK